MCTHAKWPKGQESANKKQKNVCNRGRNKLELMQIRVERPRNRVWVQENNFFELNRSPTMGWGKCKKWPSGVLTFTGGGRWPLLTGAAPGSCS